MLVIAPSLVSTNLNYRTQYDFWRIPLPSNYYHVQFLHFPELVPLLINPVPA
jgi:hypothetical protein